MATVAELHERDHNRGGWLVAIEGVPTMWTNIPAIAGSGSGSWIGTAYGARVVELGLIPPRELRLGETDVWAGKLKDARPTSFGLRDFGSVLSTFKDYESDATTDSLGRRLAPTDDPAPDPAVGGGADPITIWGRHVGIEAIGPAGERRYYWCAPDDEPPGLDHFAGVGWPATRVTNGPTVWPGRKVMIYRIVQDDDGTWPSWLAQYQGGGQLWFGTMKDRGRWTSDKQGRLLEVHCLGPQSWLEKSANLSRPTKWYRPRGGVSLSGDELKIAAWIEPYRAPDAADEGISLLRTKYTAQTLASGNTLAGLTTREEIWGYIDDVVQTMIKGIDHGSVLASSNATYTADPQGPWGDPGFVNAKQNRAVQIAADGSVVKIKCEHPADGLDGFRVMIAADVRVFEIAGWAPGSMEIANRSDYMGACPVGGGLWGEDAGEEVLPMFHAVGSWSTRARPDPGPESTWTNGGAWRGYTAPFQAGIVALRPEAGDDLRLNLGDVRCEGQFSQPYTKDAQIDGDDVNASGWWVFRGRRLTAAGYLAGDDPHPYEAVALCEWVATADGDGVAEDANGWARIRTIRWEHPRSLGLDHDPLDEPWVSPLGDLECAPLGMLGGISKTQGWRHRTIPRILLSTGTVEWAVEDGFVTPDPGVNHPADMPLSDKWAGDISPADMGLAIPSIHVDWASWYRASETLPGGRAGALNRVKYPVFGSVPINRILVEAMRGAGLAWSLRRVDGVLTFGAYDPLRKLSPDDIEVTLRREDLVELDLGEGPNWHGEIELRAGGPYDRFPVRVDRNPLEPDSLNYGQIYESADPTRRQRDGSIEWPVEDGGLRNPAPWRGTAYKAIYDWTEYARQRFAHGIGPRQARQIRVYSGVYTPKLLTKIGLGTIVRVVDDTAEAPDGTRGLDHMGVVIEAAIIARGKGRTAVRARVELERDPVGDMKVWGPVAIGGRNSWNAATNTMTIKADHFGVGGGYSDTRGFTRPPWCELADGQLRVRIFQSENGRDYPSHFQVLASVVSVDADANTIELGSIAPEMPGDHALYPIGARIFRDMHKWIAVAPPDEQTAAWASIYIPITDAAGKYDGAKQTRIKK